MSLYTFMLMYQNVFNPIYFLLLCSLLIVYHEYKRFGGNFIKRILTILFAWIVAYTIYKLYFFLGFVKFGYQWIEDFFAVFALLVACLICLFVWRRSKWGHYIPLAIKVAFVLSVIYAIISRFWNISGHVTYTTAPVVYLMMVIDKRYLLLLTVPLIMVVNRPLVYAHTWLQSICGFILGLAVTVLLIKLS